MTHNSIVTEPAQHRHGLFQNQKKYCLCVTQHDTQIWNLCFGQFFRNGTGTANVYLAEQQNENFIHFLSHLSTPSTNAEKWFGKLSLSDAMAYSLKHFNLTSKNIIL
jgi:hypothetical protein